MNAKRFQVSDYGVHEVGKKIVYGQTLLAVQWRYTQPPVESGKVLQSNLKMG